MILPKPGGASRSATLAVALLLALAASIACGKKGAPLAPLVKLPTAPADVTARRAGPTAELQLRVPDANTDNTRPADITKVEVYGITTASTPTDKEWVQYGTLVGAVPVRKPAEEEEGAGSKRREGKKGSGKGAPKHPSDTTTARAERPPASFENGFDQGNLVVLTETLGDAQHAPVVIKRRGVKQAPPVVSDEWQPLLQLPTPAAGRRSYVAVGVNHSGRRGPLSPLQLVPLVAPPAVPSGLKVEYDEKQLTLSWHAAPNLPQPIQEAPAEGMLPSTPRGLRSSQGGYDVYEVPADVTASAEGAATMTVHTPALGTLPKPVNAKPVVVTTLGDLPVEFGRRRCFVVRSIVEAAGQVIESESSPAACVTPVDRFPPAPPKGLAAVGSEGAISLIWEANPEPDLAGYVVLRAEPGKPPAAVTPEPIKDTTYRDTTAVKGVRYSYTVVAVDNAGNRSEPSSAVEETGR